MRMYQPHPSKATSPAARASEIGNEQLICIADDDMAHATATIERDTDLTIELTRELAERERERRRYDFTWVYFTLIEATEAL